MYWTHKINNDCRLCGERLTERVLDLGWSALGNELKSTREESLDQDRFPLYLMRCSSCRHVQLPVVVNPERLFSHYPYVSGTSPVFVEHLRALAEKMIAERGLKPGDLVVEIGSNDGTLLRFFRDAGMTVIGVDPAKNIAERANANGIRTLPMFFGSDAVEIIGEGEAKLVLALNVFAHADELRSIAHNAKSLLAPDGAFVIEVGYLADIAEKGTFDVCYHEHLSQHELRPLRKMLLSEGMMTTSFDLITSQGGSMRIIAEHGDEGTMSGVVPDTREPFDGVDLAPLRAAVERAKEDTQMFLTRAKLDRKRVAGFGSPAKLATFAAVTGITCADVEYVVEDNPLKHGLFVPGTGIPICPVEHLLEDQPDYCIIFAWNFAESIIERNREYLRRGGRFVTFLPRFKFTYAIGDEIRTIVSGETR